MDWFLEYDDQGSLSQIESVKIVSTEQIDLDYDVALPEDSQLLIDELTISLTLPEIFALGFLVSGMVTICYSYIRFIRRDDGIEPDLLHKLCCPFWSVLRWEGFDSDKPLFALLFCCIYSLLVWSPSGTETEEEVYKVYVGETVRNKSDLEYALLPQEKKMAV